MDLIYLIFLLGVAWQAAASTQRRQRIARLGRLLAPLRVEMLMSTLIDGYLRALDEKDPERREQVWGVLHNAEVEVATQLRALAQAARDMPDNWSQVCRWPVTVPWLDRWLPSACFDVRAALAIHAEGVAAVHARADMTRGARAFMMTAELMLMQHTCHWYCRSKLVASARLMARHKTRYEQVINAISPSTRQAYMALTQGR